LRADGLPTVGVTVVVMMTAEDVELRVQQQTDPQIMAELGWSPAREAIERAHTR
jgi:hypothetical protein